MRSSVLQWLAYRTDNPMVPLRTTDNWLKPSTSSQGNPLASTSIHILLSLPLGQYPSSMILIISFDLLGALICLTYPNHLILYVSIYHMSNTLYTQPYITVSHSVYSSFPYYGQWFHFSCRHSTTLLFFYCPIFSTIQYHR